MSEDLYTAHHSSQQERPAPVNHPPQPSEAKPDLARTLRESCVRFTEAADESFFFRQIYLLLAALFGKIEDMFLLWKAGNLPPPPVHQPRQTRRVCTTPSQRHRSTRRRTTRHPKSVSIAARPIRACRTATSRSRTPVRPWPDAPTRRIERPPKPPKNPHQPASQPHVFIVTIS